MSRLVRFPPLPSFNVQEWELQSRRHGTHRKRGTLCAKDPCTTCPESSLAVQLAIRQFATLRLAVSNQRMVQQFEICQAASSSVREMQGG